MAAARHGGVSFGGAAGENADDYYDFLPSDDELSGGEDADAAMAQAPSPSRDDTDKIADALAATQISAAASAARATRAILTPIGGGEAARRPFKGDKLPDGVFARRGAEHVRVSPESMEKHAGRKANLLNALDACMQQLGPGAASDWSGDAPFRYQQAARRDVNMAGASPAPSAATESAAPQRKARDKKIPSPFTGGEESDEDDGDGRAGEPDPLYDGDMDDADAKWVQSNFGEDGASDGSLCCPCCFVTVCMSCQRHVKYTNQFRARAAVNCRVNKDEILTYTHASGSLPFQTRASGVHASSSASASAAAQLLRADEYYPVACSDCGTTVGVYDRAQQFHFFNVLPSN